jgi:hypothetical protein
MTCLMFLIYGTPRSGTTRLCYEMDARVPGGMRVLNEPFHPCSETRKAFGSECPHSDPDLALDWLLEQRDVSGIKLVANSNGSGFALRHHRIFQKVAILSRDPVDVAISLEAANQTGNWNRGDGISGDHSPVKVEVTHNTLLMVSECLRNLDLFRNTRIASGHGELFEIRYGGNTEIGMAAACLNLPRERLRQPFRNITRMRCSDSREERCSNLREVTNYFNA